MRRPKALRRLVAAVGRRIRPRVLILLYHRVAEPPTDPFGIAVTPRHFTEHLEVIRREARPISLRSLVKSLRQGRVPRRAVVVSFDDGYADNLLEARPILERAAVPATVFISSDYIGARREFWWDELEALLMRSGTLPDPALLGVIPTMHEGIAWTDSHCSEDAARDHRGWRFSDPEAPTPRHRLFRELYLVMRPMCDAKRRESLDRLRSWAGETPFRPAYRPLTAEELSRLADGQLVEAGAHTLNHAMLAAISSVEQRWEIVEGKRRLEELLGRRVVDFSYPYGSYTEETTAAVREAGFEGACTTTEAAVARRDDPFRLPRVWPQDWDGDEFARRVRGWFTD
jgi:peptidoglycan/xylan/chitin deacetylase (PgdA/CDA1 family)